jgi:EAL domain-containing protein (putative c-di-GMP-specific phosphodiesterase class I)
MIRLRSEIQISIVAEGAETEDEVSLLRELGCPYVQSGRPMPEAELATLVDTKTSSNDDHDVIP